MSLFNVSEIGKDVVSKIEFGALEIVPGEVIAPVKINSLRKQFAKTDFSESNNVVIPYWTNNHWSTYDLLMYILSKTGPADIGFFTWGLGKQALELIKKALDQGVITDCHAVFDKGLQLRKSNIHAQALMILPNIGYTEVHGKAFVVSNENYSVTAITTSNMTKNRRLEFGVIFTQRAVADEYFSLIKSITDVR